LSSILPGGLSTDDFNASTTLKLGPLPTTEKLKDEVQRTLVREGLAEPSAEPDADDAMKVDEPAAEVKVEGDDASPTAQETVPPLPANFKTMDVAREVEKVKDARKAIRLGPIDTLPVQGESSKMALPSVLAFTMFDNGEG
jgi:transcription initiation factor TFIID subunit 5